MVDGISEGTGCVDDSLSADLEGLSGSGIAVLRGEDIADLSAHDLAVGILLKTSYFNVVENSSAVVRSSQSESDIHSRVVVLTIVVHQRANHVLPSQERECLESLVLAHVV